MPAKRQEDALEEFDAFDEYQLGFVDAVLHMQGIEAPTEDEFAAALRTLMDFKSKRPPDHEVN